MLRSNSPVPEGNFAQPEINCHPGIEASPCSDVVSPSARRHAVRRRALLRVLTEGRRLRWPARFSALAASPPEAAVPRTGTAMGGRDVLGGAPHAIGSRRCGRPRVSDDVRPCYDQISLLPHSTYLFFFSLFFSGLMLSVETKCMIRNKKLRRIECVFIRSIHVPYV